MDIKKTLEEELNRPMDRREFLTRAGGIALSILGVTAALAALRHPRNESTGSAASTYGASKYGGR